MKNISKAVVKRFIIINIFFSFFIQSCNKSIKISDLVFKDCIVYHKNQLFSGTYELKKGDKHILSKVSKGKIVYEKTFVDDLLLMEKKYDSCGSGLQIVYDQKGQTSSTGQFKNEKRVGLWKYFLNDSVYFVNF